MSESTSDIVGYECKFVVNVPARFNDKDDMLFVKENIHYKDGRVEPSIRMIENYSRDFYVTREGYRKHTDKQTSEEVNRLQKFSCNQRQLAPKIARLFNQPTKGANVRRLANSPYLYGADISSATLLKKKYLDKWPELTSPSSLAILDIETDMCWGTEEVLCIALTMRSKAFLIFNRKFLSEENNTEERIQKMFELYLKEYKDKRNIQLEVAFAQTPGETVQKVIAKAHEWKPDFVAAWNSDFDLGKMILALENENYDLGDVFSDPSVPRKYRTAWYKRGQDQKITASGKIQPLSPWEKWHTLIAPCSFYFVDSMATYAFIRKAAGMEPSYKLDNILNKELGIRKLNFTMADKYQDAAWHVFMQSHYKVEYGIYNLFDCISCELLDEKTKDLCITLPELSGCSEFSVFNSTPKQLADDLHFYFLERGRVISSLGSEMSTELDEYTISLSDHIITLPAHLTDDNGLVLCKDIPELRSLLRKDTADVDIRSAYPWGQIVMNVSKETTRMEICDIEHVTENTKRNIGLNLTGGVVNAVEYCNKIHNLPPLDILLEAFENS